MIQHHTIANTADNARAVRPEFFNLRKFTTSISARRSNITLGTSTANVRLYMWSNQSKSKIAVMPKMCTYRREKTHKKTPQKQS